MTASATVELPRRAAPSVAEAPPALAGALAPAEVAEAAERRAVEGVKRRVAAGAAETQAWVEAAEKAERRVVEGVRARVAAEAVARSAQAV